MSGNLVVFFDGAAYPNPGGPCAYGFVVYRDGKSLVKACDFIGDGPKMSSNVAEFSGLNCALEWLIANQLNTEQILVKGDSKLVIKLMQGKWHSRGGLYAVLYLKARQLKWKFPNIKFKWIPRENNTVADALSKKGMKMRPEV